MTKKKNKTDSGSKPNRIAKKELKKLVTDLLLANPTNIYNYKQVSE